MRQVGSKRRKRIEIVDLADSDNEQELKRVKTDVKQEEEKSQPILVVQNNYLKSELSEIKPDYDQFDPLWLKDLIKEDP